MSYKHLFEGKTPVELLQLAERYKAAAIALKVSQPNLYNQYLQIAAEAEYLADNQNNNESYKVVKWGDEHGKTNLNVFSLFGDWVAHIQGHTDDEENFEGVFIAPNGETYRLNLERII